VLRIRPTIQKSAISVSGFYINRQSQGFKGSRGWKCSSVVEHMLSMCRPWVDPQHQKNKTKEGPIRHVWCLEFSLKVWGATEGF
jgi:hypothetical protein